LAGLLRAGLGQLWALSPSPHITSLIAITPDECAEYMWNSIYTTVGNKPGAWRTGWKGEDLGKRRYYGDGEKRRKLWEHTSAVVEVALGRITDSATYMN